MSEQLSPAGPAAATESLPDEPAAMPDAVTARDVRAESWAHLVHLLYEIEQGERGRYRSDYLYRGMASARWGLETSLVRLKGDFVGVEGPLLRSFRKYAEPGSIPGDSLWVRLAVAQHHGLPTRVLDWTVAPRVALHFATDDERYYDEDGVVWCVDITKARQCLPPTLQAILWEERAYLFSVEMLEHVRTLRDFDALVRHGEFVLFFEPPSLDARIVNQAAVLSVMPGPTLDLDAFLRHHPLDLYRRIIIPKALKWEVRDKLDQDNVTERMLFPGLDGLSRWLKRYYGPGPGGAGGGGARPVAATAPSADPPVMGREPR
jgi:hypothetical protein